MLDIAQTTQDKQLAPPVVSAAPRSTGFRAWLRGSVPTLLIFGALAGLAVWGHHTGWTLPKFSELTGVRGSPKDDWCAEHSVPESICVECSPGVLRKSKSFGWCKEHGVHECPLCHPEVAQLGAVPQVTDADRERARRALDFALRAENDSKCKKTSRRLQFASQAAADKAGIKVDVARLLPMVELVAANGELSYDQTRVARLSSRVPGSVWQVEKKIGDRVTKGEVLLLVDAAEVGRSKAEFLQAFAQLELRTGTFLNLRAAEGVIPARTLREAETACREARIRLLSVQQALINLGLPIQADELKGLPEDKLANRIQLLGLPESLTRTLDPKTTTANLLPIKAPLDGVVVACETVPGEVVDAAKLLFVVADTGTMWLNLDVRTEDAKLLQLGQTVHFRPDGHVAASAGTFPWYHATPSALTWVQTLDGKVTWISTAVDEKTRTVKVRAELANDNGQLRASTFGSGRIVLRQETTVVVPKEAVQWEGCCHIVFVQDKNYAKDGAPKVYHVRKVVPGVRDQNNVEIIAGVLPGEIVATAGSGVLRSELLKNDLGAG